MGCTLTADFAKDPSLPGHDELSVALYRGILLTDKEINRLLKEFKSIESRGLGLAVEIKELLDHLGPKSNNELTLKLFRKFAIHHCDRLNLCEFISGLWSFLTLPPSQLPPFCFVLFDPSGSKQLPAETVMRIAGLLYDISHVGGEDIEGQALTDALINEKVSIMSVEQFERYSSSHPMLCDPILRLQAFFRAQFVGAHFWKDLAGRREKDRPERNDAYFALDLETWIRKNYYFTRRDCRLRVAEGMVAELQLPPTPSALPERPVITIGSGGVSVGRGSKKHWQCKVSSSNEFCEDFAKSLWMEKESFKAALEESLQLQQSRQSPGPGAITTYDVFDSSRCTQPVACGAARVGSSGGEKRIESRKKRSKKYSSAASVHSLNHVKSRGRSILPAVRMAPQAIRMGTEDKLYEYNVLY